MKSQRPIHFAPVNLARWIIWSSFALLLFIAPKLFGSGSGLSLLSQMGTVMIFALSYNMLLGQSGMLSFGHAVYSGLGAFFAIGVLVGEVQYDRRLFGNPEATTGHSSQGDTIKEPFCIFEWNHFYARWEWFHTAISRCERLSDVWIYVGASTTSKVESAIYSKITGHKIADAKAGRTYEAGTYVDVKWVREELKKNNACCHRCRQRMSLEDSPGDQKQWSINRLNNDLAHTRDNCEVCCLSCNKGYRT